MYFKDISGLICQQPGLDPHFLSFNRKAYGYPSRNLEFLPRIISIKTTCFAANVRRVPLLPRSWISGNSQQQALHKGECLLEALCHSVLVFNVKKEQHGILPLPGPAGSGFHGALTQRHEELCFMLPQTTRRWRMQNGCVWEPEYDPPICDFT
ncbi:hypothetical protein KPL70_019595 [Citrus sinensis]|nr:hypothetical protein KPL70_019595 [Citrus sinensis]